MPDEVRLDDPIFKTLGSVGGAGLGVAAGSLPSVINQRVRAMRGLPRTKPGLLGILAPLTLGTGGAVAGWEIPKESQRILDKVPEVTTTEEYLDTDMTNKAFMDNIASARRLGNIGLGGVAGGGLGYLGGKALEVNPWLTASLGSLGGAYLGDMLTKESAEYRGRQVTLNKPTKGDVKKKKVYVKNDKGNVVKVEFGDPNMTIKKHDPARRKSFRARHKCDNPGPKWKARYWSCKAW